MSNRCHGKAYWPADRQYPERRVLFIGLLGFLLWGLGSLGCGSTLAGFTIMTLAGLTVMTLARLAVMTLAALVSVTLASLTLVVAAALMLSLLGLGSLMVGTVGMVVATSLVGSSSLGLLLAGFGGLYRLLSSTNTHSEAEGGKKNVFLHSVNVCISLYSIHFLGSEGCLSGSVLPIRAFFMVKVTARKERTSTISNVLTKSCQRMETGNASVMKLAPILMMPNCC